MINPSKLPILLQRMLEAGYLTDGSIAITRNYCPNTVQISRNKWWCLSSSKDLQDKGHQRHIIRHTTDEPMTAFHLKTTTRSLRPPKILCPRFLFIYPGHTIAQLYQNAELIFPGIARLIGRSMKLYDHSTQKQYRDSLPTSPAVKSITVCNRAKISHSILILRG